MTSDGRSAPRSVKSPEVDLEVEGSGGSVRRLSRADLNVTSADEETADLMIREACYSLSVNGILSIVAHAHQHDNMVTSMLHWTEGGVVMESFRVIDAGEEPNGQLVEPIKFEASYRALRRSPNESLDAR